MAEVPAGTTVEVESTGLQALRASAVLTTSYVDCTNQLKIDNYDQVTLFFDLTVVAGMTSFEWRVTVYQTSGASATSYNRTSQVTAGGVTTETLEGDHTIDVSAFAPGTYRFRTSFAETAAYVRVEVKATGTVVASALAVTGVANKR